MKGSNVKNLIHTFPYIHLLSLKKDRNFNLAVAAPSGFKLCDGVPWITFH